MGGPRARGRRQPRMSSSCSGPHRRRWVNGSIAAHRLWSLLDALATWNAPYARPRSACTARYHAVVDAAEPDHVPRVGLVSKPAPAIHVGGDPAVHCIGLRRHPRAPRRPVRRRARQRLGHQRNSAATADNSTHLGRAGASSWLGGGNRPVAKCVEVIFALSDPHRAGRWRGIPQRYGFMAASLVEYPLARPALLRDRIHCAEQQSPSLGERV